jgi:hypothetical protein
MQCGYLSKHFSKALEQSCINDKHDDELLKRNLNNYKNYSLL